MIAVVIAIACFFVRMLCDCFKSRRRLEAEILVLRTAAAIAVCGDPQSDGRVVGAQITEAFPRDSAPKYLIRDNDRAFGGVFKARVRAMGIRERLVGSPDCILARAGGLRLWFGRCRPARHDRFSRIREALARV